MPNKITSQKSGKATLNYEYRFHEKFSGGVGCGTTPLFYGGELVGVGYGIFHFGKEKNNFVASTGLVFSSRLILSNLGLGTNMKVIVSISE